MKTTSRVDRVSIALLVFLAIGAAVPAGSQGMLFVAAPPVAVGQGSGQVVLADVNRDGHLDMVTQHLLQRRVVVGLGDGTGKFAAAAGGEMTLGYQPGTITVGDVNNDRIPDLGIASRGADYEKVGVFLAMAKADSSSPPDHPSRPARP